MGQILCLKKVLFCRSGHIISIQYCIYDIWKCSNRAFSVCSILVFSLVCFTHRTSSDFINEMACQSGPVITNHCGVKELNGLMVDFGKISVGYLMLINYCFRQHANSHA